MKLEPNKKNHFACTTLSCPSIEAHDERVSKIGIEGIFTVPAQVMNPLTGRLVPTNLGLRISACKRDDFGCIRVSVATYEKYILGTNTPTPMDDIEVHPDVVKEVIEQFKKQYRLNPAEPASTDE